jgi:hypothetical protein
MSATSTPGTVNGGFAPPAQLFFFLGKRPTSSTYAFTEMSEAVSGTDILSNAVVGQFNGDLKPDVAILDETSSATSPVLLAGTNTTSSGFWGECNYPKAGQAIAACSPEFSNNNVVFNVAANSFGLTRKIELWIDGKKKGDDYDAWTNRAWVNWDAIILTPGSHTAAFIRSDVDNRTQEQKIAFTVPQNCYAGSLLGVTICSPTSSGDYSSPVLISAAAHISGTIARMEIWINGKKVYSELGNTSVGYYITLPPSSSEYRIVVIAINSAGQQWSKAVYAHVQ